MLRASLPKREKKYKKQQWGFSGIDRTADPDAGALYDARGADLACASCVRAAPGWEQAYAFPPTLYPQSMSRVGDCLVVFCREMVKSGAYYYQQDTVNLVAFRTDGAVFTGHGLTYRQSGDTRDLPSDWNLPRSMVQFNVYRDGGALSDAVGGAYDKKLLIFPDKLSVDYPIAQDDFVIDKLDAAAPIPDLRYVSVHAARLFGVDAGRIYASAYNDPADWDVDTAADIGAQNAWAATTGADTRADGDFTAICAYDGGVLALKREFAHLVSGECNPFRMRDSDAMGTVDARSVALVQGKLYFTKEDGVMCYDGSAVRRISDPLAVPRFHDGIAGAYLDAYYLLEDGVIYVYHTTRGVWSAITPPEHGRVISLAAGEDGLYALTQQSETDSRLYRLAAPAGSWYVETDLYAFSDLEIKRISGLELLCSIPEAGRVRVSLLRDADAAEKAIPIADSAGKTGSVCLRALIRTGAGHAHRLRIDCEGGVCLRALTLSARKGTEGYAGE